MIGGRVALLLGLFVVPVLLLWLGHWMRNLKPLLKGVFWGGIVVHSLALALTLAAAILPPIEWAVGGSWRGFAVHYSLLLGASVGALVGAAVKLRR